MKDDKKRDKTSISFSHLRIGVILTNIYFKHVAKARLAFLWENWIGYPLKVWPSGTACLIESWNSSFPAEIPEGNRNMKVWYQISTYW